MGYVLLCLVALLAPADLGTGTCALPTYAAFRAGIEAGGVGTVSVGLPDSPAWEELADCKPGVYSCRKVGGKCLMEIVAPVAVPQLRAPLFQSPCSNGRCPKK